MTIAANLTSSTQVIPPSPLLKIKHINALELEADALIYSTNVLLNCTGGMGADLVERYGVGFQEELHGVLAKRGTRFASQGEVIDLTPAGVPYKKILHTLPCDPMYETSDEILTDVLSKALRICADAGDIRTVAMTALATGYGRILFDDFLRLMNRFFYQNTDNFSPVESVTLCVNNDYSYKLAQDQIREEELAIPSGSIG